MRECWLMEQSHHIQHLSIKSGVLHGNVFVVPPNNCNSKLKIIDHQIKYNNEVFLIIARINKM